MFSHIIPHNQRWESDFINSETLDGRHVILGHLFIDLLFDRIEQILPEFGQQSHDGGVGCVLSHQALEDGIEGKFDFNSNSNQSNSSCIPTEQRVEEVLLSSAVILVEELSVLGLVG